MRLITQTRTYTSRLARRGAWLIVMLALVVVLALSACSRGGATGTLGSQGNQGTTGTGQVSTGTTATVDDIAQTDSDLDAIVAALDSANLDAGLDQSGQDTPVQP